MAQAYSYVRFSSEKQSEGDSVSRQMKLAADYAEKNNLTLDNNTYQDLGLSALHGKNATEGLLGKFLEAVDKKIIPAGSYLLVESLDRISRAEVDEALDLFLKIVRRGIILVTLQDGNLYSKEKLKSDRGISLIIGITVMIRAHEESAMKQFRVKESWIRKRAEAVSGRKMTAMCPSWMKLSDDRMKWILKPDKVAMVQRMFELALSGLGTPSIARMFNAEGLPTMQYAKSWTFGTINAVLKNAAVIGHFTPNIDGAETIKDYYPPIIPEAQFYQVKDFLQKRLWVPGHNIHRVMNLFSGLCYCAECQTKMMVASSVSKFKTKTYLKCKLSNASKECSEGNFPYYAAERAILDHLGKWIATNATIKIENITNPRAELESKKSDVAKKIENLIDALQLVNSEQIRERIIKLQEESKALDEELGKLIDPSTKLSGTIEAFEMLGKMKQPELLTPEERLKVQTLLKRIIDSVYFKSGDEPTVAVKYHEYINPHVDYIDVRPFMDKVGGNRRKLPTIAKEL